LRIRYEGEQTLSNVVVSIGVYNGFGEGVLFLNNEMTGNSFDAVPPRGTFVCAFNKLPLLPGSYTVNLYCTANGITADWVIDAARIDVAEGDFFETGRLPPKGYGALAVSHDWKLAGC
jgi:lipopolysaccharide transport system ATP-binding protein